jgi:hypothetical protein
VQRRDDRTQVLTGLFRAASWLAVALSGLNAGILLVDGLMHYERLRTQYLIVTMVAALMFGAVGAAIFGLHWGLDRIRRRSTGSADRIAASELAAPWAVVHMVVGLLLAVTIVLMAGASIAMIERLGQGQTIFG